jgi:hypothetical protein
MRRVRIGVYRNRGGPRREAWQVPADGGRCRPQNEEGESPPSPARIGGNAGVLRWLGNT